MLNTNKGWFYDATECCHTYCLAWIARQRDACDETVSSTVYHQFTRERAVCMRAFSSDLLSESVVVFLNFRGCDFPEK